MARPALPSPPPPPRNDRTSEYMFFREMDTTSESHKYVVDYLIKHNVIKKARRSFAISPYKYFYVETSWYSAKLDRAYVIEDENKKLHVAALITSATLHYDNLNEVLLSNWGSNDDTIGDNLLFSPSSTFEPLRGTCPTGSMGLVYSYDISSKMPWLHKLEKMAEPINNAMYTIGIQIGNTLAIYHREAISKTYSSKCGQYFNGFYQAMEPVIASNGMDTSCTSVYPTKITVNPTQFILYLNALGDRPKITLYSQYARYVFAHEQQVVYRPTDQFGNPLGTVSSDTAPLVIGKYSPNVYIWSYEEFEARCAKVDEHADPKSDKEVKAFIEKIAAVRNGECMAFEINKFADHFTF